jgi:phage terminase small subunit
LCHLQALDQAHSDINKDVLESLDQTSFKESKAVEADAQAAAADVDGQEAVSEQVAAAAADQALDVEAVKVRTDSCVRLVASMTTRQLTQLEAAQRAAGTCM